MLSTASQQISPLNAPQWTVDKDCLYLPAEVDVVASSNIVEVVTAVEAFHDGVNTCTVLLDGSMSLSTNAATGWQHELYSECE